jgi:formylglycine-generating enzyme required for sulfatase activity
VAFFLSWYDAVAFASWKKARLPTRREMTAAPLRDHYLFWWAAWFDEEASHMASYESVSREFHGINPDVRLPTTALAVIID